MKELEKLARVQIALDTMDPAEEKYDDAIVAFCRELIKLSDSEYSEFAGILTALTGDVLYSPFNREDARKILEEV